MNNEIDKIDKSCKDDVLNYLLHSNNKGGQYTRESGFKKHFPDLYCDFKKYFEECVYKEYSFIQLLYHYFNNDKDMNIGKCLTCGKRCKFNNFRIGYNDYCSTICHIHSDTFSNKVKETCLKKYGCENVFQNKDIKDKIKETRIDKYGSMCSNEQVEKAKKTKLERYGTETYVNVEKSKQTKLERYGDEGYHNIEQMKQTKLERYGDEGYHNIEQMKKTNLVRYGVESVLSLNDVHEQSKKKCLSKYGVEYYSQTKEFGERVKKTKLERYGDEGYHNIEQMKQTNLERYGVEYVFNNEDIKDKIKKTNIDRYGKEYSIVSDFVQSIIKENNLLKYGDINAYRGKLHSDLKKKYEEIIDFDGDNYICKCQNECCNKCKEKRFTIKSPIFYRRKNNGFEMCPILNPIKNIDGTSEFERDVILFIKNIYSGVVIEHDRNVLCGKEVDIYLPELKIAFEINGLYWHCEVYKDKDYHYEKYKQCESKGIQLIQIWEDDWYCKRDIIESIIKSKIGVNNKIYARKCYVKEITSKECKEFVDKYHLQGYINSKIRIGLFYNGELVEVATFGCNRKIMNSNNEDNCYELYRLCSKSENTIIGGFGKILKYFENTYKPSRLITYASLDISNGNVYKKFFDSFSYTNPGYYWMKDGVKYYRYNFNKHKLVSLGYDKDKTENQIMHENGYFKIYDAGNLKFIKLYR